ncbi:3'-5' exoribonuclease [mine drainage metagenome]|uniref:3'-5' exoribonuclease n=1 Tax=mine drainage metagenome TaxID=410659 RepID=A0A1J5RWX5_9ZZZZ
MLTFFDTEFSALRMDPRLISVGLISEDERELYAEPDDTYQIKGCSTFVQEAVLPHLEGGAVRMTMHDHCASAIGSRALSSP